MGFSIDSCDCPSGRKKLAKFLVNDSGCDGGNLVSCKIIKLENCQQTNLSIEKRL